MPRLSSLIAPVALLALSATPVLANETWNCTYVGHWSRSSGGGGDFTWRIRWRKSDEGWRLSGDYQDSSGSSRFDGKCANKSCRFWQRYIGGSLDGKTYYYQGSYTDTWYGDSKTVNQFTGTWGSTRDGNDGNWSANATCIKQ